MHVVPSIVHPHKQFPVKKSKLSQRRSQWRQIFWDRLPMGSRSAILRSSLSHLWILSGSVIKEEGRFLSPSVPFTSPGVSFSSPRCHRHLAPALSSSIVAIQWMSHSVVERSFVLWPTNHLFSTWCSSENRSSVRAMPNSVVKHEVLYAIA